MKFYMFGSGGDTFVNVCKLYHVKNAEVVHGTQHKCWYPMIRDLYSLVKIPVSFFEMADPSSSISLIESMMKMEAQSKSADRCCVVESVFTTISNEPDIGIEEWPHFEKLDEPYLKLGLPEKYSVLVVKSGRTTQPERRISIAQIKEIIDSCQFPIVVVGTDNLTLPDSSKIIDLRNKTTFIESLSIAAHCQEMHAYHGIFSFFAPSQKIQTFFYEKKPELVESAKKRLLPSWMNYVMFKGLR